MCVCVKRERERKREGDREIEKKEREEREYESAGKLGHEHGTCTNLARESERVYRERLREYEHGF